MEVTSDRGAPSRPPRKSVSSASRCASAIATISVASQPCVVCGRTPSDPHHIKFAEQRAMGRKVSDRFTVPICRLHHRELHRRGNERSWWQKQGIDPMVIAASLWAKTHAAEPAAADVVGEADQAVNAWFNGNEASADWPQSSETSPIPRSEAS